MPLLWVPTTEQLADELTKRTDGENIRKAIFTCLLQLVRREPTAAARDADSASIAQAGYFSRWLRWIS